MQLLFYFHKWEEELEILKMLRMQLSGNLSSQLLY